MGSTTSSLSGSSAIVQVDSLASVASPTSVNDGASGDRVCVLHGDRCCDSADLNGVDM